jgi:hypothetical protein
MKDKKPSLSRLRNIDPQIYAQLCEEAGCYGEALKYYAQRISPMELIHAAELASRIGRKRQVKTLCQKAQESAELQLKSALENTQIEDYIGRTPSKGYQSIVDTKKRVKAISELLMKKR